MKKKFIVQYAVEVECKPGRKKEMIEYALRSIPTHTRSSSLSSDGTLTVCYLPGFECCSEIKVHQ